MGLNGKTFLLLSLFAAVAALRAPKRQAVIVIPPCEPLSAAIAIREYPQRGRHGARS